MRMFILTFITLSLSACAMDKVTHFYQGAELPTSELSVIDNKQHCILTGNGKLLEINGERIQAFFGKIPCTIAVQPGEHTFTAQFETSPFTTASLSFDVELQPGKTYIFRAHQNWRKAKAGEDLEWVFFGDKANAISGRVAYLVDAETKKIVKGAKWRR